MISFNCPTCSKSLWVPDDKAGKRTKCPGCQQGLVVPESDQKSYQGTTPDKFPPAYRPEGVLGDEEQAEKAIDLAITPSQSALPISGGASDGPEARSPRNEPDSYLSPDDPPFFAATVMAANVLQNLGILIGAVCFIGSVVVGIQSTNQKPGDSHIVAAIIGAVLSAMSIAWTILVSGVATVLVDIAHTQRAIRKLAEKNPTS